MSREFKETDISAPPETCGAMNRMKARFVDTKKFSEMFGVPVSTLETWRSRGGGPPYIKIGRSVLYDIARGVEHFENNERNNTSETSRNVSIRHANDVQSLEHGLTLLIQQAKCLLKLSQEAKYGNS